MGSLDAETGIREMHALIIEDDSLIALLLEDMLRPIGYTSFAFAVSADAAVAAAVHRPPDLITADVRLEPGSGIDAVQTICSKRAVPVVFVTATSCEVRAWRADAIVVQKPFAATDLKAAVSAATA
jgi:DNA-binding response OmpR family regulator